MNAPVYDASALLAVIFNEPGTEQTLHYLAQPEGRVSAVNWSEVGAKLAEHGMSAERIGVELAAFGLDVVPFDETQANAAAALRPVTRALGLSLGDRCCLALAQMHAAPIITAYATWKKLKGFNIIAVRGA